MADHRDTIHNERVKLTANGLNTLAAGTMIAGGVTPLVAIAYGLRADGEPVDIWIVMLLTLIWISAGVTLHYLARQLLGRLRP